MISNEDASFERTVELINRMKEQIAKLNKEIREITEMNKRTIELTRRLSNKYCTRDQSIDTRPPENPQSFQH